MSKTKDWVIDLMNEYEQDDCLTIKIQDLQARVQELEKEVSKLQGEQTIKVIDLFKALKAHNERR